MMNDWVIGFTGTRKDIPYVQEEALKGCMDMCRLQGANKVVHGDCEGADAVFARLSLEMGFYISSRPGLDKFGNSPHQAHTFAHETFPPERYFVRNRKIVETCNILLACSRTMEETDGGTWYTINYARKMNRSHVIVFPDGTTNGRHYGVI